jgi:protein ImuB
MTIAHARALLSGREAHVEPHEPGIDARALTRLAERATSLVPIVAPDPPEGLLMDIAGCERLYGGVGAIVRRARRGCALLGLASRVAVAPTFGAAWALARFGERDGAVVGAGELRDALAPLPVRALRLDAGTAERLREVGVERIAHVLDLPRGALADRGADDLLLRLDQAFGRAIETIDPVRPHSPVVAERDFDGPTDRIETIEACAWELLASIVGQLAARESGCRRLDTALFRSDLPPVVLSVRVSRPTRDERHLRALLTPKVERAHLGFGVERIALRAHHLARLRHGQLARTGPDEAAQDEAEVARLVDTLADRLGGGRLVRAAPIESHRPERAFRFERCRSVDAPPPGAQTIADADRPSLLLRTPTSIGVTLLAPEGPIIHVRLHGAALHITSCVGPERIGPEWWRGQRERRDYYRVASECGRVLWVYRQEPGGAWFVHGEWA